MRFAVYAISGLRTKIFLLEQEAPDPTSRGRFSTGACPFRTGGSKMPNGSIYMNPKHNNSMYEKPMTTLINHFFLQVASPDSLSRLNLVSLVIPSCLVDVPTITSKGISYRVKLGN